MANRDRSGLGGLAPGRGRGRVGLGLVELAVVAEETSRACLPGPFLATVWAAMLLARINNHARTAPYLNPIVEGKFKATVALLEPECCWNPDDLQLRLEKTSQGWQLNGRKIFVLDAGIADVVLCIARQGQDLAVVSLPRGTAGMTATTTPAIDATRKLYDVTLKDVSVADAQILAIGEQAASALEYATQVATNCDLCRNGGRDAVGPRSDGGIR